MIAEREIGVGEIWAKLAAKLPAGAVAWRQDGKPTERGGKWFARFVAYVEAGTVRERLDSVVPGDWDLTLDLLPSLQALAGGEENDTPFAFKARLQVLGVVREDVGVGKDYKQASTDAFKRAAVRFGIGHELYDMEPLWVQLESGDKYAKPVEDPAITYARKFGGPQAVADVAGSKSVSVPKAGAVAGAFSEQDKADARAALAESPAMIEENVRCPKCDSRMWDNRASKRNPKAPDFKCRDRACDGVIWPPKGDGKVEAKQPVAALSYDDFPSELEDEADELPF